MKSTVLFEKMVRIDSESGNEGRFADFCVEYLSKLNFKVYKDDFDNVIAYNYRTQYQTPLLLAAHLDTVSPGKGIVPEIRNNRIVSAGCTILGADNKLAIAVYFNAIESAQKSRAKIKPIEIILTCQEELGMIGAKHLDFSKIRSKVGVSFDAEGPIYGYISSSPHAEVFNVEVTGRASHASVPEKGIDALKIFSRAYTKLLTGRVNQDSTINFGLINGGSGNNTVIDRIISEGNIRTHSKVELKKLKKNINRTFSESAKEHGGKAHVNFSRVMDGYKYSKNSRMVQLIEKRIGRNLSPVVTNSGSDASIFNVHGIKVVELCHGVKNTHTVNESVSLKNFSQLHDIVQKLVTG